jgi:hypothetical protein
MSHRLSVTISDEEWAWLNENKQYSASGLLQRSIHYYMTTQAMDEMASCLDCKKDSTLEPVPNEEVCL